MPYIEIICIFLFIIILILLYRLEFQKENFEIVEKIKPTVNEEDPVNSKYYRDESNLTTEVFFYVNDPIPTPIITAEPLKYTPCPPCKKASCDISFIYLPCAQTPGPTNIIADDTSTTRQPVVIIDGKDQEDGIINDKTDGTSTKNPITSKPKTSLGLKYYYTFEKDSMVSGKLLNAALKSYDANVKNATIDENIFNLNNGSIYFNNKKLKQGVNNANMNGAAQYVLGPTLNSNDFTDGISISLWIRPEVLDTTQNYSGVLSLGSSYDDNLTIGILNNNLYYSFQGIDCDENCIKGRISTTSWTHFVWIISNDGNHTIYVNGVAIDSVDSEGPLTPNTKYPLYLGVNYAMGMGSESEPGAWYYYSGHIDDLRIYNRVLTNTDVSKLNSGKDVN